MRADKVRFMGRTATRKDLEKFCRNEGWAEIRGPRGTKVRHHDTYELTLPDGRILRTRISRPVGKETYGPSMWAHILRDQLAVSDDQFWDCVDRNVLPDRPGVPTTVVPPRAISAGLVRQLLAAGVPHDEIANMDKDAAVRRLNKLWSKPT